MKVIEHRESLPLGGTMRGVATYSLKGRADANDKVIYCTDGQDTGAFAQHFYGSGGSDEIWFVGADCSFEFRNAEYVFGVDETRFAAHESFFVNDLVNWTARFLRIDHDPSRSAVFGYSCGAAFAATVGVRHPSVFTNIFAFSIADRPITDFDLKPNSDLSNQAYYLRVGSREPKGMKQYMKRLAKWLRSGKAQVNFETLSGGHEFSLWSAALIETVYIAFGSDE